MRPSLRSCISYVLCLRRLFCGFSVIPVFSLSISRLFLVFCVSGFLWVHCYSLFRLYRSFSVLRFRWCCSWLIPSSLFCPPVIGHYGIRACYSNDWRGGWILLGSVIVVALALPWVSAAVPTVLHVPQLAW
jgi:hypothetical protein